VRVNISISCVDILDITPSPSLTPLTIRQLMINLDEEEEGQLDYEKFRQIFN
jgi:hypothetical protein